MENNGSYSYREPKSSGGKSGIIIAAVVALVVIIAVNAIILGIMKNNMQKTLEEKMAKQIEEQLDVAVSDGISDDITNSVANTITDRVSLAATEQVSNTVTSELINELKRTYNLPDDYTTIGVLVATAMEDSVFEITASGYSPLINGTPKSQETNASQSTGTIISTDGYVITNAHCVTLEDYEYRTVNNFFGSGTQAVSARTYTYNSIVGNFKDSTETFGLTVISYDTDLDLALCKMNTLPAKALNPVVFGDSDLVNMGEELAVMGNAQGLGISITTGVASDTVNKTQITETLYEGVIQTDAAVNPGNSGGAVYNIYSECVGIVAYKITASYANEGMGFAIASDEVISYINKIATEKALTVNYLTSTR